MQDRLVSVVIPCYNAALSLEKTIASALIDEYSNFEVILVDDGSEDSTPEIIRKFEQLDRRVRGYRQLNAGVSTARNTGVALSSGEYIAFLDADDVFLENSLSARMSVFAEEDEDNLIGVFCPAVLIDKQGHLLRSKPLFDYGFPDGRVYFSSTPESIFNPSCVILKKQKFIQAGGFNVSLTNGEDYELWHKLMRRGGYFKQIKQVGVGWTQHPDSVVHSNLIKHYYSTKKVSQGLFAADYDDSAEEYQQGFGSSAYLVSLNQRAFSFVMRMAVNGQNDAAKQVAGDLNPLYLDHIGPDHLFYILKTNIVRFLCRSEQEWPGVWLEIKEKVFPFVRYLLHRFDENCYSLSALLAQLNSFEEDNEELQRHNFSEMQLIRRFVSDTHHGTKVHVDVGGHIGSTARLFAEIGWHVIAFEPEPRNYRDLCRNLSLFGNVQCVQKAVSDVSGQSVPFYVSTEHWGIHALKPFHPTHQQSLTVETIRLDEALQDLPENSVGVLKIDIEGADFMALKSFDYTRQRPEVIICEFMDDRSQKIYSYTHHDVAAYMAGLGYKTYVSEWSAFSDYEQQGDDSPHRFLGLAAYPLDHDPAWGNLIFIPDENAPVFEKFSASYFKGIGLANTSVKKKKVIYLPEFQTAEEFKDQYFRMLWYLHPMIDAVERIYLPCTSNFLAGELSIPNYMDPEILTLRDKFRDKAVLIPGNDPNLMSNYMDEADLIVHWKEDDQEDSPLSKALSEASRQGRKVVKVDNKNVRYEGSFYLRLSHDANRDYQHDLHISRMRFLELLEAFKGVKKGYIFGTGPTLAEWEKHDFSDGEALVCNSMVKNLPLLERLQPKIVIVGDPIFHAGCSSYAGEFREHLYRVMDAFNPKLIVPFRDFKLYTSNLPARYAEKVIGIPMEHFPEVNLDLKANFIVRSTSNILTLLLLPVACTLFDEIGMMGFDGRKIQDNQYFWTHHKESQFNEQMESIKQAHPAFFSIDYDDYYLTHLSTLEEWLSAGENLGKRFYSSTELYIPAIQKRMLPEATAEAVVLPNY